MDIDKILIVRSEYLTLSSVILLITIVNDICQSAVTSSVIFVSDIFSSITTDNGSCQEQFHALSIFLAS